MVADRKTGFCIGNRFSIGLPSPARAALVTRQDYDTNCGRLRPQALSVVEYLDKSSYVNNAASVLLLIRRPTASPWPTVRVLARCPLSDRCPAG